MSQLVSRNIALDIMKGLGMLIVIKDHLEIIPIEYRHFTMSFMMPMFFVLGGYLYHAPHDNFQYVKKSFLRLYLPYIVGVIIFIGYLFAKDWTDLPTASRMFVGCAGVSHYLCKYWRDWPCVGAFWFFPALFWCRIIFNFIYTNCGKWRYFVLAVTSVAGYLLLRYVIHLPLGISEGLSVLIFYLVGHLFARYQSYMNGVTDEKKQKRLSTLNEAVLVICLICWVFAVKYSEIVLSAAYYKHFFLDFFGACGIIYVYYIVCKYIAGHLPNISKLFVWLGGGSLFILWIHRTEAQFGIVSRLLDLLHYPVLQEWFVAHGVVGMYSYIHLFVQYVFCALCLLIVMHIPPLRKFFGIVQQ